VSTGVDAASLSSSFEGTPGWLVQRGYEMLTPALECFFLGETRRPVWFMGGSASDFFSFPIDSSRIALKARPRQSASRPTSCVSDNELLQRETTKFIGPDLWTPNIPDLKMLLIILSHTRRDSGLCVSDTNSRTGRSETKLG